MRRGWIGIILVLVIAGLAGLALADGDVDIASTFPDAIFRNYVSENFDLNKDGKLDEDEILEVQTVSCRSMKIESLEGIEVFCDLLNVYCSGNKLTRLDLSKNRVVGVVYCENNQIEELKLGKNEYISFVSCYGNRIDTLNVSGCPNLVKMIKEEDRLFQFEAQSSTTQLKWEKVGSITVDCYTTVTDGSVSSKPLINSNAKRGTLAPTIECPDSVALGSDVEITITAPEGASGAYVYVYGRDGSASKYITGYQYNELNCTVKAAYGKKMEDPGVYSVVGISCTKDADGRLQFLNWTVKTFKVTGTKPAAPKVTAASAEVTKDSKAQFTISAQKGKKIEQLWLSKKDYNGNESTKNIYIGEDRAEAQEDGSITYWETMSNTGNYTYRYNALIDGLWSELSDPVNIQCAALGTLEVPKNAKVLATLAAGKPLSIDFSAVKIANEFRIEITPEEGYGSSQTVKGTGKLSIQPYGLDGGSYKVSIRAYAPGYEPSAENYETTLKVTGTRPAEPTATIPEGTHYSGEPVTVSFRADGLEAIVDVNDWYSCEYLPTNGAIYFTSYYNPYDYYNEGDTLRARISGKWTSPFQLSVPREPQQSEATILSVSNFPESIQQGEDLTFRTELPEGADTYRFTLTYLTETDWGPYQDPVTTNYPCTPDAKGNITVSAGFFMGTGEYNIRMEAVGENLRKSVQKSFTVTEAKKQPAAPKVERLNEAPKAYEDAKLRISAKGAKKFCLLFKPYPNADGEVLNPVEVEADENGVCNYAFNMMNFPESLYWYFNFTVYASAYDGTAWSAYSEGVPVGFVLDDVIDGTIQRDIGDFGLTISPANPVMGDTITLNWKTSPYGNHYRVQLDGKILYDGDDTVTSYTIDTEGMKAGQHSVSLFVYGIGMERGSCGTGFSLFDAELTPTVTADKTVIQPGETVTLTITSKSGEFIQIYKGNQTLLSEVKRDASGKQKVKLKLDRMGGYPIQVVTSNVSQKGNNYDQVASPVSNRIYIHVGNSAGVLEIPEGTKEIGAEAFANVKDVTVVLPKSIERVAEDAFDKSVTIVVPLSTELNNWFEAQGYLVVSD